MKRESYLTGLPVSDEMENVLERLNNNSFVPMDEINNLPEIKLAREYINYFETKAKMPEHLSEKERLMAYKEVIKMGSVSVDANNNILLDAKKKESYNGEIRKDKKLDIVIGLSASGKSSNLVLPLSQMNQARVVDADIVKELLSEYARGWGSGKVHKDSKQIADDVLETALESGENIIHPIVATDVERVKLLTERAGMYGYSVYLHYAEIEPNRALGRLLNRFLEEGRFVEPNIIYGCSNRVKETYEAVKGEYRNYERKEIESRSCKSNGQLVLQHGDGIRGGRDVGIQKQDSATVQRRIAEDDRRGKISVSGSETSGSWLSFLKGISKWNMDVPRGERPILLETDCKGELFEKVLAAQKQNAEVFKQAVKSENKNTAESEHKYEISVQNMLNAFRKDLINNGFNETPKMVEAYVTIAITGSKSVSVEDINVLYRNQELLSGDVKEAIKLIGNECRNQERIKSQDREI